jgi:hypothetical protein
VTRTQRLPAGSPVRRGGYWIFVVFKDGKETRRKQGIVGLADLMAAFAQ